MPYSPPSPGRTALYRIYDPERRLLYVGISVNPSRRIQQHNSTARWWHLAEFESIEWFETRSEAVHKEMCAVRREGPLYNSEYADLFDGSAEDARSAIPTHLTLRPSDWAWAARYSRRVAPIPVPVKYWTLKGSVAALKFKEASAIAARVREERPALSRVWDSQAAGVPGRWSDHAVVAWAVRLGIVSLEPAAN